ncbi:alpha-hydroxy-acid oxidizing protein [Aquabacter sp. L1I39]|uniref:alpha-hydroxy acid oxidase n=1 Tax=Aquabacter sp. L1I39 TaxID=2820278 RepID=UPI001ADB7806|nr:alpha-hydroxy acid oxidase [Aquabacter sp. L1I39]QTL02544.1 alpha-hydroxy-acid oxidizing protein [Aquabacter sp. L1I39]
MATAPFIPVCLADYERLALERLSEQTKAYLEGGAADEITLRENRAAFDRIRLSPRILPDLKGANTRLSLLGLDLPHPILVAPTAYHRLAHPEGERATAQGAGAMGAVMVVSTQASVAVEEIASLATAPLWFQLYMHPDRDVTQHLVQRAEDAGCGALVVTVDAPVSLRNREQRAGFRLPAGVDAVHLRGLPPLPTPASAAMGEVPVFTGALDALPGWDDLVWLRDVSRLPLLLKGILHPDDARRAVDLGMDGVIVSNHGGRVLDTVPAAINALPYVTEAVSGAVPVLLDGGIRRGTDILKALALGARAVLVGRPCLHGLAAAGAPGVAHVLHLLRAELEVAMALTGRTTLAQVDRSVLWPPAPDPA